MRNRVALTARATMALAAVLWVAGDGLAAPRDPAPSVDGQVVGPRPTAPRTGPGARPKARAPESPPAAAVPDPAETVRQARALRDAGKPAEAEALLGTHLQSSPEDLDVRAELAEALSDQSKDAEAAAQWERVVHARPTEDAARLRLADLYVGLDQADSALEHYQAVLEHRPNDPALRRRTGLLLLDMDRGPEAIPHLEAYSALVPGDEEVLSALQKLYAWNERPDDAMKILEKRVELHPEDVDAARELAERYLDREKETKAIALYERVVKARPDDLPARRALGQLYEWNSAPRKALEQYEAYLASKPYDAEVRARALSLSTDLALGSKARLHGYLLRSSDSRFRDLAREAVLAETGFGSWAGVQYSFFHEQDRLYFHAAGPRAAYEVKDWATVGAWYQFRHLQSAESAPAVRTILGHAVGMFANLSLPKAFQLSLGASFAHYDTGFNSGNGFLTVSRDIGPVTLSLQAERSDLLTSTGDVRTKVVSNNLTLGIDSEPVNRLLVHASGTWGLYSDWNQRLASSVGIGCRPFDLPRFELWYEYDYDHFRHPGALSGGITYFAPSNYHSHGPLATLTHPVAPWFAYGLDLHLWHVYGSGDNALLLQYGANVTFRPALHHMIQASYQRSDEVWGSAAIRYQDNQVRFSYAYEF